MRGDRQGKGIHYREVAAMPDFGITPDADFPRN